eukprot:Skav230563  [mRNA]  locus=scaffold2372:165811:168537:+ [translate_table: standard]
MAPGKTSVVLSFRGRGAPKLRTHFLHGPDPWIACQGSDGHDLQLAVEVKYKHLGVMYASVASLDLEISHRIAMAWSSFTSISRALLCNRHWPEAVRLKLFNTLILTKLLFGLGAWTTPSTTQLSRLQTCILKMLRRIMGVRHSDKLTNAEVLGHAHTATLRSRLAVERLLYARQVFCAGPEFLQNLLHREAEATSQSWIAGLQHDLQWLKGLDPTFQFDIEDLTDLIDHWQSGDRSWLARVKKAWRFHVKQEQMMTTIQQMHRGILHVLTQGGAHFSRDPWQGQSTQQSHHCHCGRTFSSAQGLASHKRLSHGEHAPEYHYIAGADCPVCLKHFWSSQRLAQHWAYIPRGGGPNPCFAKIQEFYPEVQHSACKIPKQFKSALRLDSIQLPGPMPVLPADAREQARETLHAQIKEIDEQIAQMIFPNDDPDGDLLKVLFSQATQQWFDSFCKVNHHVSGTDDLADRWLDILSTLPPVHHEWASMIFIRWGQSTLPDVLSLFVDGEAEQLVDDAFATFARDLPIAEILELKETLRVRLHRLQGDLAPPQAHRPIYWGPASQGERLRFAQTVLRMLSQQPDWQAGLLDNAWDLPSYSQSMPVLCFADGRRGVLILHLFSGRRREGDFHSYIEKFVEEQGHGLHAIVLSLDTAVSPHWGDLRQHSETWHLVRQCFQRGLVGATLAGAPCETWSEARYQQGPEDSHWPRPLRDHRQPWGLNGLTWREYTQAQQGSEFFLQTMEALAHHVVEGGFFLSEHPAQPRDESRPSTWRTPVCKMLRLHPEIGLDTVGQYLWGAPTSKPTGLLRLRMPTLLRSLWKTADFTKSKPAAVTIGKTPDGSQFRTAALKEYPQAFSKGLAEALGDAICRTDRTGQVRCIGFSHFADLWERIHSISQVSAEVRPEAPRMPDYQG